MKRAGEEIVAHAAALEDYFKSALPEHTFFDSDERVWSWSTPGGFWSIKHGPRDRNVHLSGPLGRSTWPDDETGIGITMAVLRTLGVIAAGDEPSLAEYIEHVVAECRRKYWQDGYTDAEFVAGVLAVVDLDGRLVHPSPRGVGVYEFGTMEAGP